MFTTAIVMDISFHCPLVSACDHKDGLNVLVFDIGTESNHFENICPLIML